MSGLSTALGKEGTRRVERLSRVGVWLMVGEDEESRLRRPPLYTRQRDRGRSRFQLGGDDAPRGGASSDFRAIVDDDDAYYGGRTQDPLTIPFPQDRTTTRYAPRLPDTTPVARPVGGRDLPSFSARTP